MADPPKAAVAASEMLMRIVLLGKSLWDQKGEENPEVEQELSLFLRSLEDNIQVLNGNTVGLSNSATWALEGLQQDLREASKEAHKILGKGFFDTIWDAKRTYAEVKLLRERVVTPYQVALLFVALTVELKDKENQDEFQAALVRIQNLVRAQTISSAAALKGVLKAELEGLWRPIFSEIQVSQPHKIDEGIFFLKATEAQTDDSKTFFTDVLTELEKEKAKRAPPPPATTTTTAGSKSKKVPATDTLKWYHDPITWELMCDPVKANDGRTYDRWTFIDHGSSMKRSPFDRREDRPLKIEFDDIDVRSRLFQKFPEQEEEFRRRRREYRAQAVQLASQPLCGDALLMLDHVLAWAEDDAECQAKKADLQRRFPSLTPDRIAHFKEAFNTFDSDGDGRVTLEELGVAFRMLGDDLSPAELQNLMKMADADGNGTIDFPEFLNMMVTHGGGGEEEGGRAAATPPLSLEQIQRYREAFNSFDIDGDARITVQELGTAMRLLGQNLTDAQLQALIRSVDTDGSGTLDFGEFITFVSRGQQQQEPTVSISVNLSRDQVLQYSQTFLVFDGDGDGGINARELASAMRLLGQGLSVEEAQALIDEVDLDGDGKLNLAEFLLMMSRSVGDEGAANAAGPPPKEFTEEELARYREVFDMFDRNGDGRVTLQELGTAMRLMGRDVTPEDLELSFRNVDRDGSGALDWPEFITYMAHFCAAVEAQAAGVDADAVATHPSFSPEQVETLREKFELLDRDGDGRLSPAELGTLFRLAGMDVTDEAVQELVAQFNPGGSSLSFSQFLDVMAKGNEDEEQQQQLSQAEVAEWQAKFRLFDRDGDGRITVQEMGTVLRLLGESPTEAELEDMIREGDLDGSGTLDFAEFLNLMATRSS